MKHDIKLVAVDIDGTLVNMGANRISENTTEMLKRLQSNGIKICLATGRAPIILPRFDGVAFDAFLTFNGSLCYNQSETIFSSPISHEDVLKIIRNAGNLGRPVSVATEDRLAANGLDADLAEYFSFAHLELTVAEDFETVCQEKIYQIMLGCRESDAHLELTVAEDFETVCQEKIYQIMLGCRESDYGAILNGVDGAKIAAWWDRAVDVIPASGGKGVGIRKILEFYHLDRSEAMAFGDGNNDIEMLTAVGTGIAMENASPNLKAVADDICGSAAQDGIYHYLIHRGII